MRCLCIFRRCESREGVRRQRHVSRCPQFGQIASRRRQNSDAQAFHPGRRSQSPQQRQPCRGRPFQTPRDTGPRQDGCGSRPFPLPKGSASATRKGSLSRSRRCLHAGLVEAAMRRRCHVLETPPSPRGRRTSTAPGWQARGIDLQRVETESAAQKALAIGGRRCPPIPRHSNSAEMLPRSFARGPSRDD